MTWSAFTLFLAELSSLSTLVIFFIILPFHSLLATFPVSISLIFDRSFLKSLFWMKQIQGSVRVKIHEYVHAWSEFLIVSLHVIFNFFPQLNHFYYFTSLHGFQDVENHCTHLRDTELKTGRKIPFISAFPMCYSLYNWIGDHEITTQKKYICFGSRKRTQKQAQKDMNEMEWDKMDYLIFSAMRIRKRHLFCPICHHKVPYEKQQEVNKPWKESPCKSACAIVKYALH